jgi:hypothetical protein
VLQQNNDLTRFFIRSVAHNNYRLKRSHVTMVPIDPGTLSLE